MGRIVVMRDVADNVEDALTHASADANPEVYFRVKGWDICLRELHRSPQH